MYLSSPALSTLWIGDTRKMQGINSCDILKRWNWMIIFFFFVEVLCALNFITNYFQVKTDTSTFKKKKKIMTQNFPRTF